MLTQSQCGLQAQLLEIMRMLLDSETMDVVRVQYLPLISTETKDHRFCATSQTLFHFNVNLARDFYLFACSDFLYSVHSRLC